MGKRKFTSNSDFQSPETVTETKKVKPTDEAGSNIVRSFLDELRTKFDTPEHSDLTIFINDKRFKTHKIILSCNPKFREFFKSKPNSDTIYISDGKINLTKTSDRNRYSDSKNFKQDEIMKCSPEACESFLKYLYSPTELSDIKIDLDLLLVTHNFSDNRLKNFCENYLVKTVNLETAIRSHLVSLKTECKNLEQVSSKLIAKNYFTIKSNVDFKLLLENEKAISAILNVFAESNITLLTTLQDDESNVKDKIKFLHDSDVLFTVGNQQFLGHKKILSKKNVVLKEIIDAGSSDGSPMSIKISDLDAKLFEMFLRYIYTGQVDADEVSEELLELAHKFRHDELKNCCEDEFRFKLCLQNAINFFILAVKFGCERLESNAANLIAIRYEEMEKHADFRKMFQDTEAARRICKTLREFKDVKINKLFYKGQLVLNVPGKKEVFCEKFPVHNKFWTVGIRRSVGLDKQEYLRVFLYCLEIESQLTVCSSFKLVSDDEQKSILNQSSDDFDVGINDKWGWDGFISWSELEKLENGFIKNGKITFEIDMTVVSNPIGAH